MNLTLKDAYAIQRSHLDRWKAVLKPEVFERLEKLVLARNNKPDIVSPDDVCRGERIDSIVHNAEHYHLIP